MRLRCSTIVCCFVLLALSPAMQAQAPAETETQPVRESLKESEWFDYERDNYHQYKPDEVPTLDRQAESRDPGFQVPNASGLAPFLNLLVYALIAGVAILIIYLVVRLVQERRSQPELAEELAAALVDHENMPVQLDVPGAGRQTLSLRNLRKMIEAALSAGELRGAAIYMYLFALLAASAKGVLELKNDHTAREYLQELQARADFSDVGRERFRRIARNFEYALYRGRLPDDVGLEQLREQWTELRDEVAA